MNRNTCVLLVAASALFSGSALSAVSAEEAKQLGGPTLTWLGAEKGGNKEGTIPAWTGEVKLPADYDPKDPGRLPDPWKEKPLFTITAQNMDKYAATLTVGQKALFKKYPDYRMDIYPTHRITNVPEYVKENTIKNATACKTENNGLALSGCYGGTPFPFPKNGIEVMWNHQLAYSTHAMVYNSLTTTVGTNGNAVLEADNVSHEYFPNYDPERKTPLKSNEIFWKIRFVASAPARKVGEGYLFLSSLDNVVRVWSYIPGQRRVKLAPDLAYDTPSPQSGGVQTMDQPKLFLGAMDRYDWKLVGKQERYIAPNNFGIVDYKACPKEKWYATKHFINPDCIRWELHRVWVVEATIKPQFRHILPRRTLYMDEDTYASGVSDDYDASGNLYRVTMNPSYPLYNTGHGGYIWSFSTTMDLQVGIYNTTYLNNTTKSNGVGGAVEEKHPPETYFSPEDLAGSGVR